MDDGLRHLLHAATDHYVRRDFAQARGALEKVVDKHTGFADVYNMLGVVYHDGGLFTKAQAAFERAIELNPSYTEAALSLAVLYNDLGKYDRARTTYASAVAHSTARRDAFDPFVAGKIANMHAETADTYRNAGHPDRAIDEYERALALRPTFADIRGRLGRTYMDQGQLPRAVAEFERALTDRPSYHPARVLLGLCCYSMGNHDAAVAHWQEVLVRDPGNARANMYLRMVQKQRGAEGSGDSAS